jgi:hypothetical protein
MAVIRVRTWCAVAQGMVAAHNQRLTLRSDAWTHSYVIAKTNDLGLTVYEIRGPMADSQTHIRVRY